MACYLLASATATTADAQHNAIRFVKPSQTKAKKHYCNIQQIIWTI